MDPAQVAGPALRSVSTAGDDTGAGKRWGEAAAVDRASGSLKPVLGLGGGGYALLGAMGRDIGYST